MMIPRLTLIITILACYPATALQDDDSLVILYTHNTNGYLEACG